LPTPPPSPAPPTPPPTPTLPFRDPALPWAERVADLVSRLTLDEKVGFLQTHPPAVERLGIRPYSFETECDSGACGGSGGSIFYGACKGSCSTANVTAFPQSSGMGATFNRTLIQLEGDVIGSELRAIALGNLPDETQAYGLSCFSPMINIVRDPMCELFHWF
jgi:beta-glucosidase